MTDAIQHIDVDSDEFIDAPKALRDHVKKLQSANQRLAEQNTDLTGRVTASALTDVLKEFKNPERVKRDLLADKIDPLDNGAVSKWLEANADDYAKGSATPSTNSEPDPEAEAEATAQRRFASGHEFRQPADMSKIEAAKAEITADMRGEDLIALYKKHGL